MKKCQQSVGDHESFEDKCRAMDDDLTRAESELARYARSCVTDSDWSDTVQSLTALADSRAAMAALLNECAELGEKLYPTTGEQGGVLIRGQLNDFQRRFDAVFDRAAEMERDLRSKMSK